MSLCVSIWRGVSRWLRAARGCARWSRTAAQVSGCRTALTVLSCKQSGINISLRVRWGMPRRSRGVWRSFSNRATWVRILPWPIRIAAVARAAAQQQQHQQHAARSSQPSSTQLSAKQLRFCARGAASLGCDSKQRPCKRFSGEPSVFAMFRSSLPSQILAVLVALAQQNMKEAARRLAIARAGGGTGQLCDAPGAVAPGAWGDARVRAEGGSPRAPTSIDFA